MINDPTSRKNDGNTSHMPLTGKPNNADAAREEAMGDIEQDADLSIHSPNDDLDEGETARLGEDKTDLV
ncbi:MAG TPA: hypothetical protein VEZ55_14890 [Chitinophagaceae bacterium]|jgi:hypothetical protein|nr:hypothetical protein [Chitinophagaceae bacterium]